MMIKRLTNNSGFTLIEVLVTLAILSVVSGIAADTFFSMYRNYNRANTTNEAKQLGQNILSITEKKLRDAVTVTPINNSKAFAIIKQPNLYHEIGCVEGTATTNGYIYEKTGTSSSAESRLTNDNLAGGVNVKNCSFIVDTSSTNQSVKIAKVAFQISESVNVPNRIEFKTSVPFELSVVLRNQ